MLDIWFWTVWSCNFGIYECGLCLGFRTWFGFLDLDFRISDFGFELLDLGCSIWDLEIEDLDSGCAPMNLEWWCLLGSLLPVGFGVSDLEVWISDSGLGNLDLGDLSSTRDAFFFICDMVLYSLYFVTCMCNLGFGNLDLVYWFRGVGCWMLHLRLWNLDLEF